MVKSFYKFSSIGKSLHIYSILIKTLKKVGNNRLYFDIIYFEVIKAMFVLISTWKLKLI